MLEYRMLKKLDNETWLIVGSYSNDTKKHIVQMYLKDTENILAILWQLNGFPYETEYAS